ncbi:MAG: ribosome small subunit-dependent GTPase A [Oscillospiraceae bacterium]
MEYDNIDGLILKAIGGFYYVETTNGIYECKARGVFRNIDVSPLVGDNVKIDIQDNMKGIVVEIYPRKNDFMRPPMANIDTLFIIASIIDPAPSFLVLDKLIAVCEYKNIEPVIVLTKLDLANCKDIEKIYVNAGLTVILPYDNNCSNYSKIYSLMEGKKCAFIGNTGVGKSTLLNNMFPKLCLQTGEISTKLGRGRHTTRQVELFKIEDLNSYIADTPGFGTMDIQKYQTIRKEELSLCFRDFLPYINDCKYTGCSHTVEKGCSVLKALYDGEIEPSRHNSYKEMYLQAKDLKEWELK